MSEKIKIQSRKVQFSGFDGSQLAGILDFPVDMQPLGSIIVSHCFTCTKQTLTTARLCRGLAESGYLVLRFDFTGLGESEGVFEASHFSSMVQDIECAANWLSMYYQTASVLVGHSMGGTASLAASQNLPTIKRAITLASPAYPAHVLHHFGSALTDLEQGLPAKINVAGQLYPVKSSFIDDVKSYDMDVQMTHCHLPILAISAGNDELIEPQAADDIIIFSDAICESFMVAEADHLFSNRQHALLLLQKVVNWLS